MQKQREITKEQLKAVHTLFGKMGIKDKEDKKREILAHTKGRTDSSRALSFEEAEALISAMKKLDTTVDKADKMRKKILSMAHEMGWEKPNGKIDMQRVNDWSVKYGHGHKPLDDYKYNELPQLVSQFQGAYKAYLNKV